MFAKRLQNAIQFSIINIIYIKEVEYGENCKRNDEDRA